MSSPTLPAFFFQILKKSIHHGKHIEIEREIPPNLYNARIIRIGALTEKIKSRLKALEGRNAWCKQVTPLEGIHYAGINSKNALESSRQINLLQLCGIQHSVPTPSRILWASVTPRDCRALLGFGGRMILWYMGSSMRCRTFTSLIPLTKCK